MLARGQRRCERFRAAPGFPPGGETGTGLALVKQRGTLRYAVAERNARARVCLPLAAPCVLCPRQELLSLSLLCRMPFSRPSMFSDLHVFLCQSVSCRPEPQQCSGIFSSSIWSALLLRRHYDYITAEGDSEFLPSLCPSKRLVLL